MEFMRHTVVCWLLDRRRYEDILGELNVDLIENKLVQYKQKWLNHVSWL